MRSRPGKLPRAADFLRSLIDDTRQIGDTLVHGDYSPKKFCFTEAGWCFWTTK